MHDRITSGWCHILSIFQRIETTLEFGQKRHCCQCKSPNCPARTLSQLNTSKNKIVFVPMSRVHSIVWIFLSAGGNFCHGSKIFHFPHHMNSGKHSLWWGVLIQAQKFLLTLWKQNWMFGFSLIAASFHFSSTQSRDKNLFEPNKCQCEELLEIQCLRALRIQMESQPAGPSVTATSWRCTRSVQCGTLSHCIFHGKGEIPWLQSNCKVHMSNNEDHEDWQMCRDDNDCQTWSCWGTVLFMQSFCKASMTVVTELAGPWALPSLSTAILAGASGFAHACVRTVAFWVPRVILSHCKTE